MKMKKTMKTEDVFATLADKYYEYSFAAEYNKALGTENSLYVEMQLRESLSAINEIVEGLGFREKFDYDRVEKEYTRKDGFSFKYWVIKSIA